MFIRYVARMDHTEAARRLAQRQARRRQQVDLINAEAEIFNEAFYVESAVDLVQTSAAHAQWLRYAAALRASTELYLKCRMAYSAVIVQAVQIVPATLADAEVELARAAFAEVQTQHVALLARAYHFLTHHTAVGRYRARQHLDKITIRRKFLSGVSVAALAAEHSYEDNAESFAREYAAQLRPVVVPVAVEIPVEAGVPQPAEPDHAQLFGKARL